MSQRPVEVLGRQRLLDDFFHVDAVAYRFQCFDGRTSAVAMIRPVSSSHASSAKSIGARRSTPVPAVL